MSSAQNSDGIEHESAPPPLPSPSVAIPVSGGPARSWVPDSALALSPTEGADATVQTPPKARYAARRQESQGDSNAGSMTTGSAVIQPHSALVHSPGPAPQQDDTDDCIGLKVVSASGRLRALEKSDTFPSLKSIPVRDGTSGVPSSLPGSGVIGVGANPLVVRKPVRSILSRVAIPSLSLQLRFHRRLRLAINLLGLSFFVFLLIGFLWIHFSDAAELPPSTFHHKNTDGEFYPMSLRICAATVLITWMVYVFGMTIWSLKRSKFFPFNIRPLLLVHSSNFFGILIVLWASSRYILSDALSLDGGDGLFPPCLLSQLVVGLFHVGLILPYILRAFQLAMIFSTQNYGTRNEIHPDGNINKAARMGPDGRSESISQGPRGVIMNGVYVPPSPSLHSQYSETPAAIGGAGALGAAAGGPAAGNSTNQSAESTPKIKPQPSPRSYLTAQLMASHNAGQALPAATPPRGTHARHVSAVLPYSTPRRSAGVYAHLISSHPTSPALQAMTANAQLQYEVAAYGTLNGSPGGVIAGHHRQTSSSGMIINGWPSGILTQHNRQISGGRAAAVAGGDVSPLAYPASAAESPFISPAAHPAAGAAMTFPNLDAEVLPSSAVHPNPPQAPEKRGGFCGKRWGCLDNLNDFRLSWIYFLLLLPFLSLTILSYFIPALQPITDFYCTDRGPASTEARVVWVVFGSLEILAFTAGLLLTREVWDGFEIRRELIIAVGCQTGFIAVTLASIFTHRWADSGASHSAYELHQMQLQRGSTSGSSSSSLDKFNIFLAVLLEFLTITRSILLFHVSIAMPLVDSYDLNALPVNKARRRVHKKNNSAAAEDGTGEFFLRDRSRSTSQRSASQLRLGTPVRGPNGRSDSRASDYLVPSSNASSNAGSKRGSKIHDMLVSGNNATGINTTINGERTSSVQHTPRHSFSKSGGGARAGLTQALLADGAINSSSVFPLSHSNLQQMNLAPMMGGGGMHRRDFSEAAVESIYGAYPPSTAAHGGGAIPVTLWYIINHPDYFQFFVAYLSRDPQMELLWSFYISIVLYQDLEGSASGWERREHAQKLYSQFFDEESLKGNTMFSQWILCMANILQQEYRKEEALLTGTAVDPKTVMGEREEAAALARVDEEIQRIAQCVFSEREDDEDLPRSLFDNFQTAAYEIFECWFYPKFLRSRHYTRLLREMQKSSFIQDRIEQAHFL
jgi:hypothetical protein